MPEIEDAQNHWTFDKRIPLGLVFGMLVQGAVGVWAWATMSANVDQLQRDAIKTAAQIEILNTGRENNSARLSVLETTSRNLDARFSRIEERLDTLIDLVQRQEQGRKK